MLQNYLKKKSLLKLRKKVWRLSRTAFVSLIIWISYGVNIMTGTAVRFLQFTKQRLTGQHTQSLEDQLTTYQEKEKKL